MGSAILNFGSAEITDVWNLITGLLSNLTFGSL